VSESNNVDDLSQHDAGQIAAVGAGDKASGARRWLNIAVAILVAVVLPIVLVDVLVGSYEANAMLLGAMYGGLGAKIGGTRRMLYIAPGIGLAAGLAAFTAYGWWWVALLTLTALIAGVGSRFGWFLPLLMASWAATFASPVTSGQHAVVYGVITALGTGYGVVLARRFGARGVVEGQRLPVANAAGLAVVFGVAVGGAAAIGVSLGWTEPYWVPEPILILTLYILIGKRERVRQKALGTTLGVLGAVPVAILAPPTWAVSLIALAAVVIALTQMKTYWLYYGLYTFALVLALAPPGQVASEAEERGFQILAGIGVLVVGLVALQALGRWQAKRHPQPEPILVAT
jgi:MFS family permease